jgi:hypothetical protein
VHAEEGLLPRPHAPRSRGSTAWPADVGSGCGNPIVVKHAAMMASRYAHAKQFTSAITGNYACCAAGSAAAITARYCPACRTINAIDLRTLDRHRDAAVTSLIPALSCRSCRPNAQFDELVRLSRMSIAEEMRQDQRRRALGE